MGNDKVQEQKQGQSDALLIQPSIISDHMRDPEFQKTLKECWTTSTPFQTKNFELITEPFRVCRIFNFLKDEEFIKDLKHQIQEMPFERTVMDLFQFDQTSDFESIQKGCAKTLRYTFLTEMKEWMQNQTGIELNDSLSMSSSMYFKGDYLLCHDDNNDDRRIAFILYLNEYWSEENGGDLGLFDIDEYMRPKDIVKRITPKYNCLLFFEVSHKSYHQVLELLTTEKCRWSINGWFHGPLPNDRVIKPLRPEPIIIFENLWFDHTFIDYWVQKDYINRKIGDEINEEFTLSAISLLQNFFRNIQYSALNDSIRDENIEWIKVGPPDIRNYEVANLETLPHVLRNFFKFLKSREFITLIAWFTNTNIVPEGEDINKHPSVSIEIQRWSKGSYSLIDPAEVDKKNIESLIVESSSEDDVEIDDDDDDDNVNDDDDNGDGNRDEYINHLKPVNMEELESNVDLSEDVFDQGIISVSPLTSNYHLTLDTVEEVVGKYVEDSNSSDDEIPIPSKKLKLSSTILNQIYNEKKAKRIFDAPGSSQDEIDEIESSEEDEYKDTFQEMLIKSEALLQVEQEIKIYETAMWMIENKKVVIPFKEGFRDLVLDRKEFYKFIENFRFDIEDTKGPRDTKGKQWFAGDDCEIVKTNKRIITRQLKEFKKKTEPVINTILEIYDKIESGWCTLEIYKNPDYEIILEDPYETIIKEENEKARANRHFIQIERLKLPHRCLEVIIPFNPLMNREEEQVIYYVDPFSDDPEKAVLDRVPLKYNHIVIVDKQRHISRVHKYVSQCVSHEFYTIVVTIYKKRYSVPKILTYLEEYKKYQARNAVCKSNEE